MDGYGVVVTKGKLWASVMYELRRKVMFTLMYVGVVLNTCLVVQLIQVV